MSSNCDHVEYFTSEPEQLSAMVMLPPFLLDVSSYPH